MCVMERRCGHSPRCNENFIDAAAVKIKLHTMATSRAGTTQRSAGAAWNKGESSTGLKLEGDVGLCSLGISAGANLAASCRSARRCCISILEA